MTEEATELDPFEAFEDMPSIMGFTFATHGEAGLRAMLDMGEETNTRENLERYVVELEQAGLAHVAGIVAEYVDDIPPASEHCLNQGNYQANERSWPYRNCKCSKCKPRGNQ